MNGKNACELYNFLTSQDTKPKRAGKVGWNFEKFIVSKDGKVAARFKTPTKPDAPEVLKILEEELAK